MNTPTNVIYIVCHDLGRFLGCYGNRLSSPNLDRFAANGLKFTNAYCNTAVCSPSRAAALSGLYAHNNGVMGLTHFGWRYKKGVKTVVDYFNEAGYETVHCGFSHEGEEMRSRYQVDFEQSWRCHTVEYAVDDALAWLAGRKKQGRTTPFYLNIGTQEVHKSIWSRDTDEHGLPSRFHRVYGGPVSNEEIFVPPPTPEFSYTRKEFSRFQSAIKYFDKHMGRLFDAIEAMGYGEDTLVVFTTDHGMVDLRGKGTLYDRGTEIALLMQGPISLRKTGVVDCLVQNIDFTPTFLEAAGIAVPWQLPGKSLWPILAGEPFTPNECIFTEWNFGGPQDDFSPIRAVRTNDFKYIRNYGPHNYDYYLPKELTEAHGQTVFSFRRFKNYAGPYQHPTRFVACEELYDLRKDPHELINLADNPEYHGIKQKLSSKVDVWMKATEDYVLSGEIPQIPEPAGWNFPVE